MLIIHRYFERDIDKVLKFHFIFLFFICSKNKCLLLLRAALLLSATP